MTAILVVYESMFGNTRDVALAVADGLGGSPDVEAVEVSDAPDRLPDDVRLLVVGGPTHAFGMSHASTRADAARRGGAGEIISRGRGLREWLEVLTLPAGASVAGATFDTRVVRPKVPGSAAKGAAKRLRRLGVDLVWPAASFWVTDVEGPLSAGEVERARVWAASLAASFSAAGRPAT